MSFSMPEVQFPPGYLAYSCIDCPQCKQLEKEKAQQVFEKSRKAALGFTKSNKAVASSDPKDDKNQSRLGVLMERHFKEQYQQHRLRDETSVASSSEASIQGLPEAMLSSKGGEIRNSTAPTTSFPFMKKEIELLNEIFSSLSLDDTLNPLEIFFIDLLNVTDSIKQISSKKEIELCFLFLHVYFTLVCEKTIESNPQYGVLKQFFFERDKGMLEIGCLFYTRKELAYRLGKWKESILVEVSQGADKIIPRIEFIRRLLIHPQANGLLICRFKELREKESIFSEMPSLCKNSREQSLRDLRCYTRLFSMGALQFLKNGLIDKGELSMDFFSKLPRLFQSLKLDNPDEVARIKKSMVDYQAFSVEKERESEKELSDARRKEVACKKIFKNLFLHLNVCFTQCFSRLFEEQILNDKESLLSYVLYRFKLSFVEVCKKIDEQETISDVVSREVFGEEILEQDENAVSGSVERLDLLKKIIQKATQDFSALINDCLFRQPCLFQARDYIKEHVMTDFLAWKPVFKILEPSLCLLDHLSHSLEKLKIEHLSLFQEMIKNIEPKILIPKSREIFEIFGTLTFTLGVLPCHFIMMAGDLRSLLENGVNAEDVGIEALLTMPLVDYMTLQFDGAKIINDHLFGKEGGLDSVPKAIDNSDASQATTVELLSPESEPVDAPKAVDVSEGSQEVEKPKRRKKRVSTKRLDRFMMHKEVPDGKKRGQQLSMSKAQHADQTSIKEPLDFTKKMRHIIPKLESLGFVFTCTKGSHSKYTDPKGQIMVIPNANKGGRRLSIGTGRAIQRELEDLS